MNSQKQIVVSGGFDDLRSRELRFLEEAAKLGELSVLLWPDETLLEKTGKAQNFPLVERLYFLEAVRYVNHVIPISDVANLDELPDEKDFRPQMWVDLENDFNQMRKSFCQKNNLKYYVLRAEQLRGFPESSAVFSVPGQKKLWSPAVLTGFTPVMCGFWKKSVHSATFTSSSATMRTSGCSKAKGIRFYRGPNAVTLSAQ